MHAASTQSGIRSVPIEFGIMMSSGTSVYAIACVAAASGPKVPMWMPTASHHHHSDDSPKAHATDSLRKVPNLPSESERADESFHPGHVRGWYGRRITMRARSVISIVEYANIGAHTAPVYPKA